MANSRKKTDTLAMATKGLALLMDDSNQCQLEHGSVSEREIARHRNETGCSRLLLLLFGCWWCACRLEPASNGIANDTTEQNRRDTVVQSVRMWTKSQPTCLVYLWLGLFYIHICSIDAEPCADHEDDGRKSSALDGPVAVHNALHVGR
jgi:hypothetical protein